MRTVDPDVIANIIPQPHRGFSHFGWSTPDLELTSNFFANVLGFPIVKRVGVSIMPEGAKMEADFFDVGDNQMVEVAQFSGFSAIPEEFDAGLNDQNGLPDAVYHYAFNVDSRGGLERRRQSLIDQGVVCSEIVDEGWRSLFFFKDPTNVTLAFECAGDDLESIFAGVKHELSLESGLKSVEGASA